MGNNARLNNVLESVTALALKLGLVVLGLATAYLLFVLFGGKLTAAATKADKDYLAQTAGLAKLMFMGGAIAVVFACCIRFFSEETTGLIMTLVGGVLHFLAPMGINVLTLATIHKNPLYLSILQQISTVGLICLVPGCLLLLRSVVLQFARIINRHSAPRGAGGKSDIKVRQTTKPYAHCWDMPQCNERVKRVCPAWSKKRSCWQVKAGCLCDQEVMKRALIERDRESGVGVAEGSKSSGAPRVVLSSQAKKERCRACTIYCDHQRQKFAIATPLAFIAVLGGYAYVYKALSQWLYGILQTTDKFMSFLTYKHGAESTFAAQGQTVTTLAMICLCVVLVSFTLRALEYLIYELQV